MRATFFLLPILTALLCSQTPKPLMPEDLFRRNIGTREQMNKQFPPHRIAGNLYYVGSESLASFLIVTLDGVTLLAHHAPGHTLGCTTWSAKIQEGGRTYDVVIIGSVGVNPGYQLVNNKEVPQIADEYIRSFKVLRGLPCDIPLGSHPAMYNMQEKYAKLIQQGPAKGPNPFIDPEGYKREIEIN